MKVFSTLAVASFMAIAGTANAGVDCSAVAGAKNLGEIQQLIKENFGFNNHNQAIRWINENFGTDFKTGEVTQAILAVCGVGSEAP